MRLNLMRWIGLALALLVAVAIVAVLVARGRLATARTQALGVVQGNLAVPRPWLKAGIDPGAPLGGRPAPNFTLTDQFGQRRSLSDYHGKVVVLAFVDPECTTVCPLTTASMADALHLLGPLAAKVQLVGVAANPDAHSVADVKAYSSAHGLTHKWVFLTGSLAELKAVWKKYGIAVAVLHGKVDHTPALFVISPGGRQRLVSLTQMDYRFLGAETQLLADEVGHALGRMPPGLRLAPNAIPRVTKVTGRIRAAAILPGGRMGTVSVASGTPGLYVFMASWLTEVYPHLATDLRTLEAYHAVRGGPALHVVDETDTEPSIPALRAFLQQVRGRKYPVLLDRDGAVADGVGVADLPWLVLTGPKGRVLWSHDGWLPLARVEAAVASKMPATR